MKKLYVVFFMSILIMFISGCIQKQIDPNSLKTSDEKALYDLMVARCHALNAKDMNMFREIYTKDSPELDWIENVGIPMWKERGVEFEISSLKKISIVGNDAAASFMMSGSIYTGYSWLRNVEVLYVKEGNQWKIESTGQ